MFLTVVRTSCRALPVIGRSHQTILRTTDTTIKSSPSLFVLVHGVVLLFLDRMMVQKLPGGKSGPSRTRHDCLLRCCVTANNPDIQLITTQRSVYCIRLVYFMVVDFYLFYMSLSGLMVLACGREDLHNSQIISKVSRPNENKSVLSAPCDRG